MSRVKIISKVFLVAGFEVPGRPEIKRDCHTKWIFSQLVGDLFALEHR